MSRYIYVAWCIEPITMFKTNKTKIIVFFFLFVDSLIYYTYVVPCALFILLLHLYTEKARNQIYEWKQTINKQKMSFCFCYRFPLLCVKVSLVKFAKHLTNLFSDNCWI